MLHLKNILIEKILLIIDGNKSAGVFNNYKEEVIKKGIKISTKNLEKVDFIHINSKNWTKDEEINYLVSRVLHNFNIKANDLLGAQKKKDLQLL